MGVEIYSHSCVGLLCYENGRIGEILRCGDGRLHRCEGEEEGDLGQEAASPYLGAEIMLETHVQYPVDREKIKSPPRHRERTRNSHFDVGISTRTAPEPRACYIALARGFPCTLYS